MTEQSFSEEFMELLRSVSARRPRTVIDHILEHGQITTEELRDIYGYNHPPRAIHDIRRLDIMWSGDETSDYDSIIDEA